MWRAAPGVLQAAMNGYWLRPQGCWNSVRGYEAEIEGMHQSGAWNGAGESNNTRGAARDRAWHSVCRETTCQARVAGRWQRLISVHSNTAYCAARQTDTMGD